MFCSLVGNFFKGSRFTLDNLVFRLHYRVTVGLLLLCAVAVLWKITYGVPIRCIGNDDFDGSYANDYCWYNGLYTNPEAWYKTVGVEVPAPGIDQTSTTKDLVSHNIHRWVIICFLAQAIFFYLPRVLWRCLEGRRVHRLLWSINDPKEPAERKSARIPYISNYLQTQSIRNVGYVVSHVFCELLNLINVVVQLFLVSHIVHSPVVNLNMLIQNRADRADPLAIEAFPLITKCSLHKYGQSSHVQRHSFLCNVSVNGVIEAIFICQWIWFAFLAIISVLAVLYRVMMLIVPQLRSLRLGAKIPMSSPNKIYDVTRKLSIGEWFLLYMLSKNTDPVHMQDILSAMTGGDLIKGEEGDYPLKML